MVSKDVKWLPSRNRNALTLLTQIVSNRYRLLLILVILCAALLRLYRLDVLPPGLFYDEAFNGVDARGVIEGVSRPLYFHGNNGREPLFIYLQSIAVMLLGYEAYSLRVVSAFVGILSVPVIFLLAKTLLAESQVLSEFSEQKMVQMRNVALWSALITAACISVSYWHVSVSRLGFRAILLPLFSSMAIFYFWRGWQRQTKSAFIWSGVWFGLSLYTYTSARLLPFVVVLFVAVEFAISVPKCTEVVWSQRVNSIRRKLIGLALLSLTVLVIALPFFYEVYQHPYLINARTEDVSILTVPERLVPGTPVERLTKNLVLVARSLYDSGDGNPRHNLPERPVNDFLLALLFTSGVAVMVIRLRQAQMRLLAIWLLVMALPTILSVEAPHSLRAMGIVPPISVLYGLGGIGLAGLLKQYVTVTKSGTAIVLLVVSVSGTITFVDYFGRWAQLPILGHTFDLQHQLAAKEVSRILTESPNTPILISRQLYLTPQMRFAIGTTSPDLLRDDIIPSASLEGGRFLFEDVPDDPNRAVLLLQAKDGLRMATWVDPKLPNTEKSVMDAVLKQNTSVTIQSPIQQQEWPSIVTGVVSPIDLSVKAMSNPLDVVFANGLNLIGYEVRPDRIDPGEEVPFFLLTLYWRDLSGERRSPGEQFELFTHLRFGNGQSEDNMFGSGYGISLWEPSEIVDTRRLLKVPFDAEHGKGFFEVGLYDPSPLSDGKRVPVLDGNGQVAGTSVRFGGVMIGQPPPQADTTDLTPVAVTFDERIELIGWLIRNAQDEAGVLEVDLALRALERPTTDYSAFVHLVDGANNIVAQYDQLLGNTENPSSLWVPDEIVRASFPLSVNPEQPVESLRLRIGLYEPVSGRQAAVSECELVNGTCDASYILLPFASPSPHTVD